MKNNRSMQKSGDYHASHRESKQAAQTSSVPTQKELVQANRYQTFQQSPKKDQDRAEIDAALNGMARRIGA